MGNTTRACDQLKAFAAERGLKIAAKYIENESGAKLVRPELFRLLEDAELGDVLLVEQVDRIQAATGASRATIAKIKKRTAPATI